MIWPTLIGSLFFAIPAAILTYLYRAAARSAADAQRAARAEEYVNFPDTTARELHLKAATIRLACRRGGPVRIEITDYEILARHLFQQPSALLVRRYGCHQVQRDRRRQRRSDRRERLRCVRMTTNCGVGATDPKAIYIRPFCIDNATFQGDETVSDGEMPIRKVARASFIRRLAQGRVGANRARRVS